jgi:hypothetical protein
MRILCVLLLFAGCSDPAEVVSDEPKPECQDDLDCEGGGASCVDGSCVQAEVEQDPVEDSPDAGADAEPDVEPEPELLQACAPCEDGDRCGGPEDACTPLGEGSFCTTACVTQRDCGPGFTCERATTRSAPQCLPAAGTCLGCLVGDPVCEADWTCNGATGACEPPVGDCGTPPQCPQAAPVFNAQTCSCVACLGDADCGEGVCTTDHRCVQGNGSCTTAEDCSAPAVQCDMGVCVECTSGLECTIGGTGDRCVAGVCASCDCEEGQVCDPHGACVDELNCAADADCGQGRLAPGRCHTDGTCYEPGACGENDLFLSECNPGLTCVEIFNGAFSVCEGCQPGGDDCKEGESCVQAFDNANQMLCSGLNL